VNRRGVHPIWHLGAEDIEMADSFTSNLLGIKTPDELATVLGFSKYSALAKLLYPSSTVDFLVKAKLPSIYKILKSPILVDLR
jgi:hypothetical protein